jgi:hypothetical protein
MPFLHGGVGHCGSCRCRSSCWPIRSCVLLLPRSSTVEVAAPAPAVHLWAELALELHQAPDPDAVGADVGLDVWRPPPGSGPGRRRAAPRTAPAAPRSADPGPGRARSPPSQAIEHKFERGSGTLRSPTEPLTAGVGRAGAATRRTLGDSSGQQGITNLEVSGSSQHSTWGGKLLDWAFTRQRPQQGGCQMAGRRCPWPDGRSHSEDRVGCIV